MCLILRSEKPKIANADIECWKLLDCYEHGWGKLYETPYTNTKVEKKVLRGKKRFVADLSELPASSLLLKLHTLEDGDIAEGAYSCDRGFIHTFVNERDARIEASRFGTSVACKCIIPKGTEYFEGEWDGHTMGYASREIVFVRKSPKVRLKEFLVGGGGKAILAFVVVCAMITFGVLLTSCQKHVDDDPGFPVTFYTGPATKGVSSQMLSGDFGVWANMEGSFFMRNARYGSTGDATGGAFYYWPQTDDEISFTAYYPYAAGASGYPDGTVAVPVSQGSDVLYARAKTAPITERVPLSFNHAMSMLEFWGKRDSLSVDWARINGAGIAYPLSSDVIMGLGTTGLPSWTDDGTTDTILYPASGALLPGQNYIKVSTGYLVPGRLPSSTLVVVDMGMSEGRDSVVYTGRKIFAQGDTIEFTGGRIYSFRYNISSEHTMMTTDDNWTSGTNWETWAHIDGAWAEHYYYMGYAPNAAKFSDPITGLDFSKGDYIEALMDVSSLNRIKQNIISIGENIKIWNTNNDGTYNLHIYFPNAEGDRRVRFSAVIGEKVNNNTRRTMGTVKQAIPDETNLLIRFDKYGFWVNGDLVEDGDFDIVDERPANTYTGRFMEHFNSGPVNIQIGSMEGNTRSYAVYKYVMYRHYL